MSLYPTGFFLVIYYTGVYYLPPFTIAYHFLQFPVFQSLLISGDMSTIPVRNLLQWFSISRPISLHWGSSLLRVSPISCWILFILSYIACNWGSILWLIVWVSHQFLYLSQVFGFQFWRRHALGLGIFRGHSPMRYFSGISTKIFLWYPFPEPKGRILQAAISTSSNIHTALICILSLNQVFNSGRICWHYDSPLDIPSCFISLSIWICHTFSLWL